MRAHVEKCSENKSDSDLSPPENDTSAVVDLSTNDDDNLSSAHGTSSSSSNLNASSSAARSYYSKNTSAKTKSVSQGAMNK